MANDLTPHHPVMVANKALDVLRDNAVMPRLVYRDFEEAVKEHGDSVQVPVIGALTTNSKSIGSNYQAQDATSTAVTVTLNQHKEVTFVIEDIERAFARGDVMESYVKSAVSSLADTVDASLTGLYSGLSQSEGTDGSALTPARMITARKTLSAAGAPTADRFFVAGTEAYEDLLGLAAFTDVSQYGSAEPVQSGELGKIYGFKVFEDANIVTATGDHNLAFQRNAFGLCVRPLPMVTSSAVESAVVSDPISGLSVRVLMWYNANRGGTQTTVEILYGVAELRDTLAVDIIT